MSHPSEERLGYRFNDLSLWEAAMVHRSVTAEDESIPSNERLEFLGDAVLQLVITEYLFDHFPGLPEGQMAKVRAAVVNRPTLAVVARSIGLGAEITLAESESASGGREKDSILADAMEAVLAAVHLDGGIEAARRVIIRLWEDQIKARATEPGHRDYKTRLQELVASEAKSLRYVLEESGPDHQKSFVAKVEVDGRLVGSGSGPSKKAAEQVAASVALSELDGSGSNNA